MSDKPMEKAMHLVENGHGVTYNGFRKAYFGQTFCAGATVHHPDQTRTEIIGGLVPDVERRIGISIGTWNTKNASKDGSA